MTTPTMLTTPEVAARVTKARGREYTKNAVHGAIQDGRLAAERIGPIWLVTPEAADAFAKIQAAREVIRATKTTRAKANAKSKARAAARASK